MTLHLHRDYWQNNDNEWKYESTNDTNDFYSKGGAQLQKFEIEKYICIVIYQIEPCTVGKNKLFLAQFLASTGKKEFTFMFGIKVNFWIIQWSLWYLSQTNVIQ